MSLGPSEIIVVLLVALLVLGPDKLPNAARQMGRAIREIKNISAGIQSQVNEAFELEDEKTDRPATPSPSHPNTQGFRLIDGATPKHDEPPPGQTPQAPITPSEPEK